MLRTRLVAIWVCLLGAAPALWADGARAAEPPAADAIKVRGKVKATKGGRLRPQEATLTTREKTYSLVLDEKGRSLVKVMSGQSAEVWGVPSEKDGASWLRVLGYPDERLTAGHELWRHMRCSACVVTPAVANSAAPKDLHGAVPVHGRYWPYREKLTAWTLDEKHLWLATDSRIVQVDLAARKLVRSYGRAEGLPDRLVYGLASDGKRLWIVHKGGVVTLPVGGEKISGPKWLETPFARALADGDTVWVISVSGTFKFKAGEDPAARPAPDPAPALPTAGQISKTVENGIWMPHWHRRTAHFIADPAAAGGKLFLSSYGDIYGFDGAKWEQIAAGAWALQAAAGRVWFLDSGGLNEYDPGTGKKTLHALPEGCRGQPMHLIVTDKAAWVAAHPQRAGGDQDPVGGGLCRLELETREWKCWNRLNEHGVDRVSSLAAASDAVWAVSADGRYETRGAHPGMAYVKHKPFVTTGFHLHTFDGEKWTSLPLESRKLTNRLICGQDGCRDSDDIFPRAVTEISISARSVFGAARLVPGKYFGGYWPSAARLASRPGKDAPWVAAFGHAPEELGLQGEQPLVLNISYGMILRELQDRSAGVLEAVGHDNVLGLFADRDTHWAVTEGCAAWYNEAEEKWHKVLETEYRFYWRATAALQDGNHLYIGSDRGLISRLDLTTGRFEVQVLLDGREITRLAKNEAGQIVALSQPAQLGTLPAGLADRLKSRLLRCEAVKFDGKTWAEAKAEELPPEGRGPAWRFKKIGRGARRDKSQGNFVVSASGEKPVLYVKDVFYPQVLCTGNEGESMWLSTYTGLVRIPFGKSLGLKE
jgi:hypothetical protein